MDHSPSHTLKLAPRAVRKFLIGLSYLRVVGVDAATAEFLLN